MTSAYEDLLKLQERCNKSKEANADCEGYDGDNCGDHQGRGSFDTLTWITKEISPILAKLERQPGALKELIAWLRFQAEAEMKYALGSRQLASNRNATAQELEDARKSASAMMGRKLPKTSVQEHRDQCNIQERIAIKKETHSRQLSSWADELESAMSAERTVEQETDEGDAIIAAIYDALIDRVPNYAAGFSWDSKDHEKSAAAFIDAIFRAVEKPAGTPTLTVKEVKHEYISCGNCYPCCSCGWCCEGMKSMKFDNDCHADWEAHVRESGQEASTPSALHIGYNDNVVPADEPHDPTNCPGCESTPSERVEPDAPTFNAEEWRRRHDDPL